MIKKVHHVLKFKQKPWLRDYINLHANLRKNATNVFEKNLRKLMNNSTFEKLMEDVRGRINVKIVTKQEGCFGVGALIAKKKFFFWQ